MPEPCPLSPRLFVNRDLTSPSTVVLEEAQAHYLTHVMRQKPGDAVRLFNGRDGEWQGVITKSAKRAVDVEIQKQVRQQTGETDLWLCAAPIKKAHFDYMIEKATELGVAVIQPVFTHRTQIRETNSGRLQSLAREAAEQSERLALPEIKEPIKLEKLAATWPKDRALFLCAERGDATSAKEAFTNAKDKHLIKAALLTGPEGGFAPEEFDILRQVATAFIRLGPRILRADTAALAALSCWQSICGDWN